MKFFTTQRLSTRSYQAEGKGIDRYFECEYMGSSEFEYGALPAALRSFRESNNLGITRNTITTTTGHTRDIYLTADLDQSAELGADLQTWVTVHCPGQEAARFERRFADGDTDARTQCWWSLSDNAAWAFDELAAENFLAGLMESTKSA